MLFTVHGDISRVTNDSFEQLVQRTKNFIEKNINCGDLIMIESSVKFDAHDKDRTISVSIDKEQNFLSLTLNTHPGTCLNSNSFGPLTISDTKKLLDESTMLNNIYRISENGILYFFTDTSKYNIAFSKIILGNEGYIKKLVHEKLSVIVKEMVYNVSMYGHDTVLENFLTKRTYHDNTSYAELIPFIEEQYPGFTNALRKVQAESNQEKINYYRRQIDLTIHKINNFGQSVIDVILGDVELEKLIKHLVESVNKVGCDDELIVPGIFIDQHKRLYFEEKYRQEEIHAGRTVKMDA